MSAQITRPASAESIGKYMARRVFEQRGNHTEVHLSEAELAALLTVAAEVALQKATER